MIKTWVFLKRYHNMCDTDHRKRGVGSIVVSWICQDSKPTVMIHKASEK